MLGPDKLERQEVCEVQAGLRQEGDAKQQLPFPTEEDGDWAAAGKQELSNLKRRKSCAAATAGNGRINTVAREHNGRVRAL